MSVCYVFFFVDQKTAYELRISDWSSDVCSSDLGFRCIGIDMRGYGKSDRPWEGYNYDVFADDIHKVLEKLDLRDVTLIGHSMGGAICIRYVTRHKGDRMSVV